MQINIYNFRDFGWTGQRDGGHFDEDGDYIAGPTRHWQFEKKFATWPRLRAVRLDEYYGEDTSSEFHYSRPEEQRPKVVSLILYVLADSVWRKAGVDKNGWPKHYTRFHSYSMYLMYGHVSCHPDMFSDWWELLPQKEKNRLEEGGIRWVGDNRAADEFKALFPNWRGRCKTVSEALRLAQDLDIRAGLKMLQTKLYSKDRAQCVWRINKEIAGTVNFEQFASVFPIDYDDGKHFPTGEYLAVEPDGKTQYFKAAGQYPYAAYKGKPFPLPRW